MYLEELKIGIQDCVTGHKYRSILVKPCSAKVETTQYDIHDHEVAEGVVDDDGHETANRLLCSTTQVSQHIINSSRGHVRTHSMAHCSYM